MGQTHEYEGMWDLSKTEQPEAMTTHTPLAETIARVERENARLPVGSCPVSQADLTALLSCARRCEAMARAGERLDDLRLMADSGMSIIPGSTVLDLIDLYEDAASERDALAKRVRELEDLRIVVLKTAIPGGHDGEFTDDAIAYQVVNLRRCTDAWLATIRSQLVIDVDDEEEHARALAKADEVLSELDTLRAESTRLRAENERLNSTDWIAYCNELTAMYNAAQDRVGELEGASARLIKALEKAVVEC